jgi:hypothetical protein
MTRAQVLESQGEPAGDAFLGQPAAWVPPGMPTNWKDGPVWHYLDRAVVFRGNRVVQVLGPQVELDGRLLDRVELARRMGSSHELENLSRSSSPLAYRLQGALPTRSRRNPTLLRDRMAESLPGLFAVKTPSFDFRSNQATQSQLALCRDWLESDHSSLRWTSLGLRRCLWECLHYRDELWSAETGENFPATAHIIASNNWRADPVQVRLRLLVDARIRLAGLRGEPRPLKIAVDEQDEAECAVAFQRLMLGGSCPTPNTWRGFWRDLPPTELTSELLRFAAAKARIVDEPQGDHPYLYPGPPEGHWAIGMGLADYPMGMSGWNHKGPAHPEARFDWENPVHRFHALWAREGAVLKPLDQDRLSPIRLTLSQLDQNYDPGPWTPEWGHGLPADEQQRELLRLIARAPHIGADIPGRANCLGRLASLAQTQLPQPLAAAVARILRFGLKFLLD